MSSILLAGPVIEPLTLAEAKDFLRVEHTADDVLIGSLIAGARQHVEAETRRALITQTWRLVLDAWPCDGRIDVRPGPLQTAVVGGIATVRVTPARAINDTDTVTLSFVPGTTIEPLAVRQVWSTGTRAGIEIHAYTA